MQAGARVTVWAYLMHQNPIFFSSPSWSFAADDARFVKFRGRKGRSQSWKLPELDVANSRGSRRVKKHPYFEISCFQVLFLLLYTGAGPKRGKEHIGVPGRMANRRVPRPATGRAKRCTRLPSTRARSAAAGYLILPSRHALARSTGDAPLRGTSS